MNAQPFLPAWRLVPAWLAWLPLAAGAQTLNFAQTPLFLGTSVKPNVLVVYDNSQSMDGTMAGKLITPTDDSTRGNIARSVLRSTIGSYRTSFNWGLASFDLKTTGLYTTYAYYFGANAEVVYTNDCVNGLSASNANLRCIANPQTGNGFNFLTYRHTGDDPAINDVLYTGDYGAQLYGIGVDNSTKYDVYGSHGNGAGWNSGDFGSGKGTWNFTPTDAGFLPQTPPNRRMFWLKRASGYYADISGKGRISQGVAADSDTQYNALMALLAKETSDNATGELKNAAVFTPLAGTLGTVKDYFANSVANKPTPISQSCQRNFVLLATDGNPTGKTDGSMYSLADQANTYSAATGKWTFGTAASDVFTRVTSLRTTAYGGKNYDVQTYVVGLGDSVANQSSIATLNRMAELGGTDTAYLATDKDALAAAFRNISVDIISRTAAASSVSLNAGSWNTGAKVYQGRFSSGDWSGQLLALPIGSDGTPAATADWDAGQKLNKQDWSAATGRQILTYKPSAALGSRGVPFRWPADAAAPAATEIDLAMVTALNKNGSGTVDGFGSERLQYIRGNTARESRNCAGCAAPVFRDRPISVLGDIVNSAPVYVGGATGDWRDTMETARYSTYANTRASQTPMIYVGANDGMLHAFNANTGAEVFAYVPYAVTSRLSALTSNPYTHQYTVDGSPAVGDVAIGGSWKTLLVSGMSAGAPGLFALDVSTPGNFTESKAANVVRWELGGSDADVGHIFGRPILAKMRDGRWRAIVGNGYNSTNGRAVLLLVDLENGSVIRVNTGSGGTGSGQTPNGLSSVTAVSTADNGVVDLVYAGDLQGNLWKFDLSSATSSGWAVAYTSSGAAVPLFTAASGQAITARPDVTRFPKGGWMVTFGTGRYIDVTDNTAGSSQTLYGIWDNGSTVTLSDLQTQSFASTTYTGSDGRTYRLSTHAVDEPKDTAISGDNAITLARYYTTKKGWKLALPSSGERVVSQSTVRGGRAIFSSLIPSTAVCAFGGDGWVIDIDVITGNRAEALDTNGDAVINDDDKLSGTYAAAVSVGSVPAAVTIMKVKKRDRKFGNTSSGALILIDEKSNAERSRRAAWEQLQ